MREWKMESQAARIFLRAAAYIRKYGWQKEGMSKHGQPRCSMGALASAHPQEEWDKNLAGLMYETLYEELAGMSLTQYNHEFKSGEKVARLYERTAKKLSHG
jgi:hypothetical protein